jgi:hypothetical protein
MKITEAILARRFVRTTDSAEPVKPFTSPDPSRDSLDIV